MANALLQAWQTNNDAVLKNDTTHLMNYTTQDPYGQLRDQMIPMLVGNYQSALRNRYGGPQLNSYMRNIGGGGPMRLVSENPIWDQNQIQQRVNAGRATTDSQRDVNIKNQQQMLSNRGFATANSPLGMAMAEQQRGLAMMGNAKMENDLRWNAAVGNAQHVQQAEMANASNQEANNANNLRARMAAMQAWQTDRGRYLDLNDPNQFMSQLMNLLTVTRPQQQLVAQNDSSNPHWSVDQRGVA